MPHPSRPHLAPLSALLLIGAGAACTQSAARSDPVPDDVYATYGVHNSAHSDACANSKCDYTREPGRPSDPLYPEYWSSNWKMYRVYNNHEAHPPPYDGKPPAALVEGQDYEASNGATYYDSTWNGGQGAMMEHYEKRCLPIFPLPNNYTCSFISLGDAAFFVTYDSDRPAGMPPVCLFSPRNHAPRRDFIKHLPYSQGDSDRLGGRVQGYSFWVSPDTGKPIQTGVSPDRTQNGDIMFGYGFDSQATPDRAEKSVAPYRHPQSFYFSGYPLAPANAPIVSQNYTDFAMIKPDPAKTWAQVSGLDPKTLTKCELFNPPGASRPMLKSGKSAPTWDRLRRAR
ncbi:hypothetical protein [Corallococcus exiguus]|uniref:hypothetical protein n=1 Tax=Corallococcus exiguus TaxID=83462 RepID=UPI0015601685|nr:hypothetical protein [Corallococcus exiguus]NRD52832.1 hypothetical protein [Corallococcus exiguus]